jgi:hypothetical protein
MLCQHDYQREGPNNTDKNAGKSARRDAAPARRNTFRAVAAGLLLAAPLLAPSASAQLFFSQDSNGNGLYEIDPATGAATLVGSGVSGVTSSTVGLAPSGTPGLLFGSKWSQLMTIQVDGEGFSDVGGDGQEGLAYCASTDTLYGAINGDFSTIDQATGVASSLASPGGDVEGIACDDANQLVYGIDADSSDFRVYDIVAGTWSTAGATGVSWDGPGLAYDGTTLYAINGDDNSLYTVDPSTGAATLVGPTGLSGSSGGLAWAGPATSGDATPVPLPLWLLALTAAAVAYLGLRRSA